MSVRFHPDKGGNDSDFQEVMNRLDNLDVSPSSIPGPSQNKVTVPIEEFDMFGKHEIYLRNITISQMFFREPVYVKLPMGDQVRNVSLTLPGYFDTEFSTLVLSIKITGPLIADKNIKFITQNTPVTIIESGRVFPDYTKDFYVEVPSGKIHIKPISWANQGEIIRVQATTEQFDSTSEIEFMVHVKERTIILTQFGLDYMHPIMQTINRSATIINFK